MLYWYYFCIIYVKLLILFIREVVTMLQWWQKESGPSAIALQRTNESETDKQITNVSYIYT